MYGKLKVNHHEIRKFAEQKRESQNKISPFLKAFCWYESEIKIKNNYEMEK